MVLALALTTVTAGGLPSAQVPRGFGDTTRVTLWQIGQGTRHVFGCDVLAPRLVHGLAHL
jgi:hypothetical protein